MSFNYRWLRSRWRLAIVGEDIVKKAFAILALSLGVSAVLAQGTVEFFNTPTTLVSVGEPGGQTAISGPPGSYYFGLFIAAVGTIDPAQFTFTQVYATNRDAPFAGRFDGGSDASGIAVPGWPVGVSRSYFVAGWSASLGHNWNQQWLGNLFDQPGFFGLSSIGTGSAGGPGLPGIPPLSLFGPFVTEIHTGWNLSPIPEPSSTVVMTLGAAVILLHWRGGKRVVN